MEDHLFPIGVDYNLLARKQQASLQDSWPAHHSSQNLGQN